MRRALALTMGFVLLAAACGDDDSGGGESGGTAPAATEPAEPEPEPEPAATDAPEPEPEPTDAPEPAPTDPPETTTTTTEPPPPLNVVGLVPLPGAQLNFSGQAVPDASLVWSLYSGSGGIIVEDVIEPLPNGCHGTSFFDPATLELLEIGGAEANAYTSVGVDGCANMNQPSVQSVIDGAAVAANTGSFIQFDFGELPPLPFDVSTQIVHPEGGDGIFRAANPDEPFVINDLTDTTHVIGWSDLFEPDPDTGVLSVVPQADTRAGPGCTDLTLCLKNGRFEVDALSADGNPGLSPVSSDDTGLFFFFSPEQIDAYLTILNGCDINDHFWVFAASTTNVEYTLTVTDTSTETTKEYIHDFGLQPAEPILDTEAFATCP